MITIISLSILAIIWFIISMGLFIIGMTKKDGNVFWFGAIGLLILTAMTVCYFKGWLIPVIVVIGLIGTALTFMGTSGEESEESFKFGIVYLCAGLFLFFNAFSLWYETGHYTSMAFAAWFFCISALINALNCPKDYIPVLSLATSILFALLAIYLWMMFSLKGMPIFFSGTFAAIFVRSLYWLVYGRKIEADSKFESDSEKN